MPDGTKPLTPEAPKTSGHDCQLEIDSRKIAYDYFPGSGPTIVFLPAFFFSRWRQAKANALEIFAKRKGQAILVEEYRGTGHSSGDFDSEGTISQWIEDTVRLVETVVEGKIVLVGAGIGAWIMLHVAERLGKRVVGMVGASASLDFTQDLLWPSLTEEQKVEMEQQGFVNMTWGFRGYRIGKALLEDAKKWLVLPGDPGGLRVECPVRLLQGLNDEEIPSGRILRLVERLASDDVVVQFVKGGEHVMDSDEDLHRLWAAVCEVGDKYFEYDLTSPSSG